MVNGDEYENIELRRQEDMSPDSRHKGLDQSDARAMQFGGLSDPERGGRGDSSGYGSESGDMLREMVKNKELMKTSRKKNLPKLSSVDSETSEGSTLVSTTSDNVELVTRDARKGVRIKHHVIRSVVSDSEVDAVGVRHLMPCCTVFQCFLICMWLW